MMGRRLYVGNLPYTTGEAELQELFSRAGTVESVRVMRDAATGRARGFAFVEMATDEEAQKAASELNQFQMGGRALTVNEARPKPEGRSGHATHVWGGHARRSERTPHRDRLRRGGSPCVRDEARRTAGHQRTGSAQSADAQAGS